MQPFAKSFRWSSLHPLRDDTPVLRPALRLGTDARWLTRSGNEDEHIRHDGTAWRPQRLAAVGRAVKAALAAAVGSAGAQTGPEALSHREYQVYRLLTQGRTVSEIGAQLGLAPNTVSTYRARVLEKTGAKNDVELALYAERHARAAKSP